MARKAGPVGRDDVLAELQRVVDEAVAGRGHLLLLAGEAGIGKTTMLTAAAGFAKSRGVRVGWGWGWPGEGAPGYWPWVQVMRMLGLDIPWPAEASGQPVRDAPASERFRLFDEVTSLLLAESRIQPLLLLLDDLQWADQPSQLLLDFLARRLPAGAVAVAGSYRDTEPTPGPAPGPVLAALAARTTVLPLAGLGPDAVGDLVADVVGEQRAAEVAAGVHRRTGGNPFFVQQVSWRAVGAWPTNDGLLMTYLAWPAARFDEFRRDVEGNFLRTLDTVGLGERIRAGRRAERFRGTPDLPSYLRQPYGPGWALVGDAGLLMDPVTGQGISHAFRDAKLLADAVADGLGGIRPLAEALRGYHRARDRAARPMYDFTARLAAISPPTPAESALLQALARRQQDADMFVGALAGSVPLRQFMSPRTMVRLVGVGGFARLAFSQARPQRPGAHAPAKPGRLEKTAGRAPAH